MRACALVSVSVRALLTCDCESLTSRAPFPAVMCCSYPGTAEYVLWRPSVAYLLLLLLLSPCEGLVFVCFTVCLRVLRAAPCSCARCFVRLCRAYPAPFRNHSDAHTIPCIIPDRSASRRVPPRGARRPIPAATAHWGPCRGFTGSRPLDRPPSHLPTRRRVSQRRPNRPRVNHHPVYGSVRSRVSAALPTAGDSCSDHTPACVRAARDRRRPDSPAVAGALPLPRPAGPPCPEPGTRG